MQTMIDIMVLNGRVAQLFVINYVKNFSGIHFELIFGCLKNPHIKDKLFMNEVQQLILKLL